MHSKEYNKETNILLVDDDETLLKFFKIHLNKFFSRIAVVKNVKEAVEVLKTKEIDLVISDIRMPREDGIQLMRKVRLRDPSIPVFLISGAVLSDKQTDSVETKADGFLEKPFELEELHQFILKGLKTRDIYQELFEIVGDKKKFQNLIRGKAFPKISDEAQRERAKELRKELSDLSTIQPSHSKSA